MRIRAVANATSPSPQSLWAPLPRVWSRVKAVCAVVNCPARAASMSSGKAEDCLPRSSAASEIDRVEDDAVQGDKVILKVPEEMLLQEASDG